MDWLIFGAFITSLMVFDLGYYGKKDEVITFRKSLYLSLFYVILALIFGLYVYADSGLNSASEYYLSYLIEKTMALDNIFIISMILQFFGIPEKYKRRVLFWGIIGVIVLRIIVIYLGIELINNFSWVIYVFAIILIVTGIKTWFLAGNDKFEIEKNFIYIRLSKIINIHPEIKDNSFIVKQNGKYYATKLLAALILIEVMDFIFAIDSLPAIFAITNDIFVIYTSNIMAILGLRAMYFMFANITKRFKYVKYGLAIILVLIGLKIIISHFIEIPKIVPLLITVGILIISIAISIIHERKQN